MLVIVFGLRFNSDILDLLPKNFDSVQALKTTDREFTNARQIIFALSLIPQDADLEEITARFCDAIAQGAVGRPRHLQRRRLNPPDGIADLQSRLAVPLLLNLDPPAFSSAMQLLQPARITARLHELRAKMETHGRGRR